MKLIDEIVEDSTGDVVALTVILRKCMVVASRLGNARLKRWAAAELDGYAADDQLPDYRTIPAQAYGMFVGIAYQLNDHPIAPAVLEPEHRALATTFNLQSGIPAYESLIKSDDGKDGLTAQWPAKLIGYYQRKISKDYSLLRAWQRIPVGAVVNVVETVRNRVLEFALELQGEIGGEETPSKLAPDNVEKAVVNIIYGGTNVLGSNVVGNLSQSSSLVVLQGDFASLQKALAEPRGASRTDEGAEHRDRGRQEGRQRKGLRRKDRRMARFSCKVPWQRRRQGRGRSCQSGTD